MNMFHFLFLSEYNEDVVVQTLGNTEKEVKS